MLTRKKKLIKFLGYNEEREPREFNTHRNKMKAKRSILKEIIICFTGLLKQEQ